MPDAVQLRPDLRGEIKRRAADQLLRKRLCVDYYRIGQKLYYDLPVRDFPEGCSDVTGIPNYPYAIWLLWDLEERIFSLGWHAELEGSPEAQSAVELDLAALAGWERFRQRVGPVSGPELCSSHISRILRCALRWKWLRRGLRARIRKAIHRLADDGAGALQLPRARTVEDLVAGGVKLSNISVIGALGLAMAARAGSHPRQEALWNYSELMTRAWLEHGLADQIEGVCYDGYVADFLMDWLAVAQPKTRRELLGHPRLSRIMEEIAYLGAPDRPENLALLGDVEPNEMRFHYSFATKFLNAGAPLPSGGFSLPAHASRFLRCDALEAFSKLKMPPRRRSRPAILDAHYAVCIDSRDSSPKAAVSWSNSRMGHMQRDTGSLVLAVGEEWLITDPGYRQYMPTLEKEFTLGPLAHNQPIINGHAADGTLSCRDFKGQSENGARLAEFELAELYPSDAGVERATRIVLSGDGRVIVRDVIQARGIKEITYCWHGNRGGYWSVLQGEASIYCGEAGLRIRCVGHELAGPELCRLPGSRGEMSLLKTIRFPGRRRRVEIVWEFVTAP